MTKVLQSILYVEDEPDIQRIVKLALEAVAGMRIVACSSGSEAIARAGEAPVDLILLDVMMPQMDGPTTLRRLREIPALKNTPAIFMTAKAHPTEIAHFKSLGALDVIAKPFDPMTLADTLRGIWMRMTTDSTRAAQTVSASAQKRNAAPQTPEARFAERMAALTAQFRDELPSRLTLLQRQWHTLSNAWSVDEWSENALRELHGCTHNLAGSGSTFGYDELTERARAVDRHFKMLLLQQHIPDAALQVEIHKLFTALEAELQRIVTAHH